MKTFNTTGVCIPEKHYMVDVTKRVEDIRRMVDEGKYFCINRARQYGKTTTLTALRRNLMDDYCVISLDFQGVGDAGFRSEEDFSQAFCGLLKEEVLTGLALPEAVANRIDEIDKQMPPVTKLNQLFRVLNELCFTSDKPVVLLIDEVDSATNNQVFLDFLAQLRKGYLDREAKGTAAFQSVVLAGVTDVKHLKSKIRDDDQHKVNSPWNIAADFTIDMRLPLDGIAQMLEFFFMDHGLTSDPLPVAQKIIDYTDGYPYLVSRICQIIDDFSEGKSFSMKDDTWSTQGVDEAVHLLLKEEHVPLFESLIGKLQNHPTLDRAIEALLMRGESIEYQPYDDAQSQLRMYGFVKTLDQKVVIANRIFESLLYDYYLGKAQSHEMKNRADLDKNMFVENGRLNMTRILERFVETYHSIFGKLQDRFKEKDGRELFLLYLKPIINGTGNYYIEAQTRDQTRTDIIVDYAGEQFVIECKIWRGDAYHRRGEQQLSEYLDYFRLDHGYMLSFNFNQNKESGVHTICIGDKTIVEAVV